MRDMMRIVGTQEVRRLIGDNTPVSRAKEVMRRPGFPEPVAVLHQGRVWLELDVVEWLAANVKA